MGLEIGIRLIKQTLKYADIDDIAMSVRKSIDDISTSIFRTSGTVTKPIGLSDELIINAKTASNLTDVASPSWDVFEKVISGKISLLSKEELFNHHTVRVRKAYEELEQIMIARNPAKNNDPKKLNIFANRYLRNSNFVGNEDDMLKYLDDIKRLMLKKDPKGEPLLGARFIDYMTNSRQNKISPQKYKELMDLVDAAEVGYITKDVFNNGYWFELADGVNPKMLKDIAMLRESARKGIKPIDYFIPSQRLGAKVYPSQVKNGEMFEDCLGKVYMGGKKNISHEFGDLNREEAFYMFQPIIRYFIEQGKIGTCYELAAYQAILNSNDFAMYLTRRITKEGDNLIISLPSHITKDNIFRGQFESFTSNGHVKVKLNGYKYIAKNEDTTAHSNPLIQALETLYGAHRKFSMADEYIKELQKAGKNSHSEYHYLIANMDNTIITKNANGYKRYTLDEFYQHQMQQFKSGKLSHEPRKYTSADDYYKDGGRVHRIFDLFFPGKNCEKYQMGVYPGVNLDKIRDVLEKTDAMCFSTISKVGKNDTNFINIEKSLAYSHAYTILSYDRASDIVTYTNPWNTALIYKIKLADLADNISEIDAYKYAL